MSPNTLVVIPARMASTRLPNKPCPNSAARDDRAGVAARDGSGHRPVLVAADGPEIVGAIVAAGGQAVATDPDLPSVRIEFPQPCGNLTRNGDLR